MTTVAVAPVRRWIRRTQAAHLDGGETFSTFYFAVLFVAVVGGMIYHQLRAVLWPEHPNASGLAAGALVLVVFSLLYLALRRFGPIALSRPATSWLLTAPVNRRSLLAPSMRLAGLSAAVVGALGAFAIVGHAAPRPAPLLLGAAGALAGVLAVLVAIVAQAGRRAGGLLDAVAYLAFAVGVAGLVTDAATDAPRVVAGWPTDGSLILPLGVAAVVVGVLFTVALGAVARTPNERLLESAKIAGTLADSAYGVEPSFVAEMVERRYWARRRLRSTRLWQRIPVLTAQDLLLAARRPRRLLTLAGAVAAPTVFVHWPAWLLGLALLIGGLLAASTSTAAVRTDAANPFMLRLLGLSSRQAIIQRLIVPGVLAALWTCASLTVLTVFGMLPPGPWWALGLVTGPVGAMAAVRRARVGLVNNSLLPIDTPMGSVSTGPLLASVIGYDGLLFGLPTLIAVALGDPLSWSVVLIQAAVAVFGVQFYLSLSTSNDRVELAESH